MGTAAGNGQTRELAPSLPASLTIGELAKLTGITASNLRMWESRYGFPVAMRLPSGHRRYPEDAVESIRRVKHRRDGGVRLEAAIAEVTSTSIAPVPSVWADLRQRHPGLRPHRLRKATLLALSWALEDECCSRAQSPWLFGAFQQATFYRRAETRWRDMSRTAKGAWALADFDESAAPTGGPVEVALPPDAPMNREWTLVCLATDFPAVLTAWELPGQEGTADKDRLFESVWSLEAEPTRDAARCLANVVADLGHDTHGVARDIERPFKPSVGDLRHATDLFNRVVAYLDRTR